MSWPRCARARAGRPAVRPPAVRGRPARARERAPALRRTPIPCRAARRRDPERSRGPRPVLWFVGPCPCLRAGGGGLTALKDASYDEVIRRLVRFAVTLAEVAELADAPGSGPGSR